MKLKTSGKRLATLCLSTLLFMTHPATLLAGDCLVENWPVVFDTSTPNPSIFPWYNELGECEYGVEFKNQSAAFLQINFSDLNTPPANGPYRFAMRIRTNNLVQEEQGYLRVFEIIAAIPSAGPKNPGLGSPAIAVDLGWSRSPREGITRFFLRGRHATQHPIFVNETETDFLDPNSVMVSQGNEVIEFRVLWWPSSGTFNDDSSIELWANGQLIASKSGLRLLATGLYSPNAIRFGVIPISEKRGRGILRFTPLQPTPHYPWLD